jgi:hypothetical protein
MKIFPNTALAPRQKGDPFSSELSEGLSIDRLEGVLPGLAPAEPPEKFTDSSNPLSV